MFDSDISSQIKKLLLDKNISLTQLWSLIVVEGKDGLTPPTAARDSKDRDLAIRSLKKLNKSLPFDVITESSDDKVNGPQLTSAGIELMHAAMRFFDEAVSIVQARQNHGPSIRIGSSTTLLHWLVIPQIDAIQKQTARIGLPRPPEISFRQIERDDVRSSLLSHGLHFTILRDGNDLDARPLETVSQPNGLQTLSRLAQLSDAEISAWMHSAANPFHLRKTNGKERISVTLGQYEYFLCMREDRRQTTLRQAQKAGVSWRSRTQLALCTNHSSLRDRLLELEQQTALRVAVRTDTWVESAQLALHGDFATVLPSIVRRVKPELVPITTEKLHVDPEKVVLVFNPSTLHSHVCRQMLSILAQSVSFALTQAQEFYAKPVSR